jgi:sulfur carrier protein
MTHPALQMYSTRSGLYPATHQSATAHWASRKASIALKSATMNITINGEPRPIESGTSLDQLVQLLDLQGKRLAIEVNQEIVPRGRFASFQLSENDNVEIVHAIGGG